MKILIVTDQTKQAEKIKSYLEKSATSIEEIDYCVNEKETLKWLKRNEVPDIIFLQKELQKNSGFDIIDKSKINSAIVVLAEDDKNLMDVFKYHVLNYLVSPYTQKDIENCIEKFNTYFKPQSDANYMKDLQSLMSFMIEKEKAYKTRFMIKVGNMMKSVAVEDIAFFFSQDRVNYLVNFKSKKFPVDNTLDEIEEMLDPKNFFRANRQFIVNIDAISEIHPYFKGRVKINLNPQQEGDIVISSEKSRSFKEWLDE